MKETSNIVKKIKINNLKINDGEVNELESNALKLIKGRYYKTKNMDLTFLNYLDYKDENSNSLFTYMKIYNTKILSSGDANKLQEEDIIKKYNLGNIDILKVGHHGSKTSSSKEFIKEIDPEYSIISVGKNNRYGHPYNEVLNNLNNSKIYRTDEDGSVMFKIKNNKLKIETCTP